MLRIVNKAVSFVELTIGIFLPWKLRCRYSEFLIRLDGMRPFNFTSQTREEKQRNCEMFSHLGVVYAQEGNLDLAIENVKKALEIDPDSRQATGGYLLLASLYKRRGELDKSVDEIVNFYKIYRHQ